MFDYEEVSRDGQILDVLTDHIGGLRIMVSRSGAEMVSMARRNKEKFWTGFLYRDGMVTHAESGWNNHALVMGYFTHRIKGEITNYLGHVMRGGTHSFLRNKHFAAPEFQIGESASLTYRLNPDQIESGEYPFKVGMDLIYTLENNAVRVTFKFHNHEPEQTAHVSFGLHPGFASTSLDAASLLMPAGTYLLHRTENNFLTGQIDQLDLPAGPMPFPKSELLGAFLLELRNVPLPVFLFQDSGMKRNVYLDLSGVPYVTIWSDGHPFLCIEPCWGLPDHDKQKPFEQKTGIQEIAPGKTLTGTFTMNPQLA